MCIETKKSSGAGSFQFKLDIKGQNKAMFINMGMYGSVQRSYCIYSLSFELKKMLYPGHSES